MIVLLAIAILVALYLAASVYVSRATAYLEVSEAPWERLYAAAKELVSDATAPASVAAFAAAAVVCAGCGCLTWAIIIEHFSPKQILRRLRGRSYRPKAESLYGGLTPEQQRLFSSVVANAVFYDALSAPLGGFIVRRIIFPWLRSAAEGEGPPNKTEVAEIVKASSKAIESREEGKKLLAYAQ